ncbi:MAG: CRISPR-associated protein Csm6 [Lachnospiraceae bacterium]|nr:CRISPR-associated protein Csm6 [Lachnospiraceae bacterium]
MGKKVLFSPIGGTDPISLNNLRDGSMLHICRYYQPDQVVLFLSKEMLSYHRKDNRYVYCIHQLAKQQGRDIEVSLIERPDLEDVQEYDYFYAEFGQIIRDIYSKLDEKDSLLINISSGTPAMKSGLLVLITLGEFPCKAIQVVTPTRSMNEHTHKGFDLETVWELNEDNGETENRCREIKCPTLSAIKNEEILKKHILAYDYAAAIRMVELLPKERTVAYERFLQLAHARLELDNSGIGKFSENNRERLFPVWSTDDRKVFEYALSMDIKRRRGEYADFIRAFTPLFAGLLERILLKTCRIDLKRYCKVCSDGSMKWDINKLQGTEVLRLLETGFYEFRTNSPVYSSHMIVLIEKMSEDNELTKLIDDLRFVEAKIRNVAAHQMTAIPDEMIKMNTGYNAKQIMDLIKKLFHYSGIRVKKDDWNSYDIMNQRIIEKMG